MIENTYANLDYDQLITSNRVSYLNIIKNNGIISLDGYNHLIREIASHCSMHGLRKLLSITLPIKKKI